MPRKQRKKAPKGPQGCPRALLSQENKVQRVRQHSEAGTKSHVSVTKGGNSGRHRHEPLVDGFGSNPLSAIYYLCD